MELVSEPLLVPLQLLYTMVRGLFLVSVSGKPSGHACQFTVQSCFIPFGGCPWWPVLGFGSSLFVSLPGLLRSGHSLEVFPCSLPFLQAYIISLGPLYSTFSAKDKDKEGSSTILSPKKSLFLLAIHS